LARKPKFAPQHPQENVMCKGFDLDEPQKQALRECITRAELPQKTPEARVVSRLRAGLTMFVIGLHSGRSCVPGPYDPNNRIL